MFEWQVRDDSGKATTASSQRTTAVFLKTNAPCDNPGTIGKVLVGKESLRRLVAEDESDCDREIAVHGMGPWSVSIAGSARMCLALLPSCTRIGGRQRRNQLRQLSGISVA
jgi:hypothetical protein